MICTRDLTGAGYWRSVDESRISRWRSLSTRVSNCWPLNIKVGPYQLQVNNVTMMDVEIDVTVEGSSRDSAVVQTETF